MNEETETKNIIGVWEPIETAPKDGTRVLLYYPNYPQKEWVGRYFKNETYNFGNLVRKSEGWHTGADRLATMVGECEPSHWVPLPSPPTVEPEPA
jgi:hypothetical protein